MRRLRRQPLSPSRARIRSTIATIVDQPDELRALRVIHKALADVKWSTWAMIQNKISKLDFDFFKYGAWKHMRARSVMHDPRWVDYLRAV